MTLTHESDWRSLCAARKQRQLDLIPPEWAIQPPPHGQRNVLDIPCGILTERELEITETVNVQTILDNLRSAQWSSVEVTTAFYKRAIIAQQLVCPTPSSRPSVTLISALSIQDKLLDRDLH